ncbi:MAG: NADH-quinone oxidoreductase, chain, partial [Gammaproteobacteria bacterium]|nr:NADH-quinone oxidoreductase, chain [Gammaproteobacteria bacterium]
MIEIEIDGKKVQAEPGSMIIEAADKLGIKIPRFCYHKKLSIAANCRMCLVAVEKSRKPLPACATPITDGMVVNTQTAEALAAQKAVMEFLLINHPLDCPICDQGGECELQDLAMGYGKDISRFTEGKRVVKDKNLGSLIATDMTRCILCTRCVRFGEEVAGIVEMGMTGRGEASEIGTYVEKHLISEVSGNIIDLCPVGALTSKPFRFKARAWELVQHTSIAAHDPLGANIYIHTRGNEVMRVVPKECEAINETWASDRDRFSYTGLNSSDRLLRPMIKVHGQWQECDWSIALATVTEKLQTLCETEGGNRMAAILSPNLSIEEHYLAQKYMRGFESPHVEHRLQQVDGKLIPAARLSSDLQAKIADVETMDSIFLVGCDIQREVPLLGLRVRKASLQGAAIASLNPVDFTFNFAQNAKCILDPQ